MSTKTRIYLVCSKGSDGTNNHRLVRAATQAQALSHIVDPQFHVAVATPDELVEYASRGIKVETAGAAPQQG